MADAKRSPPWATDACVEDCDLLIMRGVPVRTDPNAIVLSLRGRVAPHRYVRVFPRV